MGEALGSLPRHLAGWWRAADGKAVLLELAIRRDKRWEWLVTVAPNIGGDPYLSGPLPVGPQFTIKRRPAVLAQDEDGVHLQIEGGIPEVGPTYWLYPGVRGVDGRWRNAKRSDALSSISLLPTVASGLYATWEDDRGMPWSVPLLPFTRPVESVP
jgi:hypothetical protein